MLRFGLENWNELSEELIFFEDVVNLYFYDIIKYK